MGLWSATIGCSMHQVGADPGVRDRLPRSEGEARPSDLTRSAPLPVVVAGLPCPCLAQLWVQPKASRVAVGYIRRLECKHPAPRIQLDTIRLLVKASKSPRRTALLPAHPTTN